MHHTCQCGCGCASCDQHPGSTSESQHLLEQSTHTSYEHGGRYRTPMRLCWLLQILGAITYTGLLAYALIVSNTTEVLGACPQLWTYMLACGLSGVAVGLMLIVGYLSFWRMEGDKVQCIAR